MALRQRAKTVYTRRERDCSLEQQVKLGPDSARWGLTALGFAFRLGSNEADKTSDRTQESDVPTAEGRRRLTKLPPLSAVGKVQNGKGSAIVKSGVKDLILTAARQ